MFSNPPWWQRSHSLQAVGVTDHLVQVVDNLAKLGPVVAFLLPAVQHELVEGAGAVHGRGQPVVLLDGVDDLQGETQICEGLTLQSSVGLTVQTAKRELSILLQTVHVSQSQCIKRQFTLRHCLFHFILELLPLDQKRSWLNKWKVLWNCNNSWKCKSYNDSCTIRKHICCKMIYASNTTLSRWHPNVSRIGKASQKRTGKI